MTVNQFLTNWNSLLRIQGPKVRMSIKIIIGPVIVEIRVVNQGDQLNQLSNQFCRDSNSFGHLANLSLSLSRVSVTIPV